MRSGNAVAVAAGYDQGDPVLADLRVRVAHAHTGPSCSVTKVPFMLDNVAGSGTGVASFESDRLIDCTYYWCSDNSLWRHLLCWLSDLETTLAYDI
jgi:hypothetical protein